MQAKEAFTKEEETAITKEVSSKELYYFVATIIGQLLKLYNDTGLRQFSLKEHVFEEAVIKKSSAFHEKWEAYLWSLKMHSFKDDRLMCISMILGLEYSKPMPSMHALRLYIMMIKEIRHSINTLFSFTQRSEIKKSACINIVNKYTNDIGPW